MSKLEELQKSFIKDCLSDEEFGLGDAVLDEGRISAAGQMSVYRESAIGNIISAMMLTYPSIEGLVGEAFFRQTCRQYIHGHWPNSGNMNDYGAEFPAFLREFELAKALPYLHDMARLDWFFHESSLADDQEGDDWGALADMAPEDVTALKISLHQSVRLLSSSFPVLKIWEMCQEDAGGDQKLDLSKEPGSKILLVRKDLKVELYPLSTGELGFLKILQSGGALFEAFEEALKTEDGETVQGYLLKHVEIGSFSNYL